MFTVQRLIDNENLCGLFSLLIIISLTDVVVAALVCMPNLFLDLCQNEE